MPRKARSDAATDPRDNERRAEIVQVSARLFREKGFERTTVRDIAAAVGMQSGSPFYYFKTKEEILAAVMSEGIRYSLESLQEALAKARTPRERLLTLFRTHIANIFGNARDYVTVLLYERRSLSPEMFAGVAALVDEYEAVWLEVINEAMKNSKRRISPKLAGLFAFGAANWTSQWLNLDGPLNTDQVAEEIAEFFFPDESGQ